MWLFFLSDLNSVQYVPFVFPLDKPCPTLVRLFLNLAFSIIGRAYIQTSSINSSSPVSFHHCCIAEFIFWPQPTKLDKQQCPNSSFNVQLAPCMLLLPHCSWGSHSLVTVYLVPQAPYPRRVPASPSGAPLSLLAQSLPIIPQVCLLVCLINNNNIFCFYINLTE